MKFLLDLNLLDVGRAAKLILLDPIRHCSDDFNETPIYKEIKSRTGILSLNIYKGKEKGKKRKSKQTA